MWFQPPIPLFINNSSHTSEVQRWCVSLPTPHVWFVSNQFSFIRRANSQPQLPEGALYWKRKCWTDQTAEKRRILQTQLVQFVNCQTKKNGFSLKTDFETFLKYLCFLFSCGLNRFLSMLHVCIKMHCVRIYLGNVLCSSVCLCASFYSVRLKRKWRRFTEQQVELTFQ